MSYNGAIIKWSAPSGIVFEWDEGLKDSIGSHYHVNINFFTGGREFHGKIHNLPGEKVPEPYAYIFFPGGN